MERSAVILNRREHMSKTFLAIGYFGTVLNRTSVCHTVLGIGYFLARFD